MHRICSSCYGLSGCWARRGLGREELPRPEQLRLIRTRRLRLQVRRSRELAHALTSPPRRSETRPEVTAFRFKFSRDGQSGRSRLRFWRNRRPWVLKLDIKPFFSSRDTIRVRSFFARNLDGSKAFQRVGLLTDSHSALSLLRGEMMT